MFDLFMFGIQRFVGRRDRICGLFELEFGCENGLLVKVVIV